MSKVNILLIVGVVVIIGILGIGNISSTMEVVNEREEVEETIEVPVEIDPIEKAKTELARINQELDEKEQAGLAERKALEIEHASTTAQLKAEYEAKLAEVNSAHKEKLSGVDSNLERIREARADFQ